MSTILNKDIVRYLYDNNVKIIQNEHIDDDNKHDILIRGTWSFLPKNKECGYVGFLRYYYYKSDHYLIIKIEGRISPSLLFYFVNRYIATGVSNTNDSVLCISHTYETCCPLRGEYQNLFTKRPCFLCNDSSCLLCTHPNPIDAICNMYEDGGDRRFRDLCKHFVSPCFSTSFIYHTAGYHISCNEELDPLESFGKIYVEGVLISFTIKNDLLIEIDSYVRNTVALKYDTDAESDTDTVDVDIARARDAVGDDIIEMVILHLIYSCTTGNVRICFLRQNDPLFSSLSRVRKTQAVILETPAVIRTTREHMLDYIEKRWEEVKTRL